MHEDSPQHNPIPQPPSTPRCDATPNRPHPPKDVRIAFLLWIGIGIILIVLLVMAWNAPALPSGRPPVPLEWRNDPAQRAADTARAAGALIFLLLEIIITAGIVLAAVKMRAGSNPARIILTVIGTALGLLILVIMAANLASVSGPRILVNLGLLTLLTGAISLMFGPGVSGFFTPSSRAPMR